MPVRPILLLLLTGLAITGSWGIWLLADPPPTGAIGATAATAQHPSRHSGKLGGNYAKSASSKPLARTTADSYWIDSLRTELQLILDKGRFNDAVDLISDIYARADVTELEQLKKVILLHAGKLVRAGKEKSASTLLETYTATFNDVDAWRALGELLAERQMWDKARHAFSRAGLLESQPEQYASTMQALVRATAYSRAQMESQGDELGILSMYQDLYNLHPDNTRIQLELAQSHLRLGDSISARPHLEALQFDNELGNIAAQKLADIDARRIADQQAAKPIKDNSGAEIVVPLVRVGNSFLVDVSVNATRLRLLLDTGASITALSAETIASLGLAPTGNTITLSTANGLRETQLFQINQIRIGKLRLDNLLVAEVELGKDRQINGLLGTDVLNRVDERLSYLIDDQQNALIFKVR